MYDDVKPCQVCGSAVRLEPHEPPEPDLDAPVGPTDGVVGGGDPTVDDRVCTNPDCATNQAGGDQPEP